MPALPHRAVRHPIGIATRAGFAAVRTDLPERWAGQPLAERSGVVFSYARQPGGMMVTITKDEQRVNALLEWAFGSGA